MKGCLGRLFWMFLGLILGIALLVGVFVLIPSLKGNETTLSRPPSPVEPDVTLTISETYLNRKVAEVVHQSAPSAITNVVVDLQPGEKVLVSLSTRVKIMGVALNPTVVLDIRVAVVDGTLQYRLEDIKVGKVPISRALLPGPIKSAVVATEKELARSTQEQFDKARFRPIEITTTGQALILKLREMQ